MTALFASPDGDSLREFLESYPGDATVGHAGHPDDCPVARYLQSLGYEKVVVDQDRYTALQGQSFEAWDLPAMFRSFVDRLDGSLAPGERIQASTALRILKEVMQ